MRWVIVAIALPLGSVGCTGRIPDGRLACMTDAECPSGYSCQPTDRGGRCSSTPLDAGPSDTPGVEDATRDVPLDAGDARTPDAPADPDAGDAGCPGGCAVAGGCLAVGSATPDGCDRCASAGMLEHRCDLAFVDDAFADFAMGSLDDRGADLFVSAGGTISPIHSLDPNHDGFLELLVPAGDFATDRRTFVYRGTVTGPTTLGPVTLASARAAGAVIADLDADGFEDLAIAFPDELTSRVYWGAAGATFFADGRWSALNVAGVSSIAAADLDRDGRLDLVLGRTVEDPRLMVPAPPIESYVVWGAELRDDAFTTNTRLPSSAVGGVAIGDVDPATPDLEIVLAQRHLVLSDRPPLIHLPPGWRAELPAKRHPSRRRRDGADDRRRGRRRNARHHLR